MSSFGPTSPIATEKKSEASVGVKYKQHSEGGPVSSVLSSSQHSLSSNDSRLVVGRGSPVPPHDLMC